MKGFRQCWNSSNKLIPWPTPKLGWRTWKERSQNWQRQSAFTKMTMMPPQTVVGCLEMLPMIAAAKGPE